jgi:hypothetical protein
MFLVSGLAAFVDPETSSALNEALSNWGTFGGALCFALGGVIQLFDSPPRLSRQFRLSPNHPDRMM